MPSRSRFPAARRAMLALTGALLLLARRAASAVGAAGVTPPPGSPPAPGSVPARITLQTALMAYERGDLRSAERQFRQLSAQGLPLGDYNLAMLHLRGELSQPDPRVARALLLRAAGQGLVRAELALGAFHEQGEDGRRDLVQAQQWYLRAARHGSVDAQVAVGTAFYRKRTAMSGEADARLVFGDVVLHEPCGAGRHDLSGTPVDDQRSVPG